MTIHLCAPGSDSAVDDKASATWSILAYLNVVWELLHRLEKELELIRSNACVPVEVCVHEREQIFVRWILRKTHDLDKRGQRSCEEEGIWLPMLHRTRRHPIWAWQSCKILLTRGTFLPETDVAEVCWSSAMHAMSSLRSLLQDTERTGLATLNTIELGEKLAGWILNSS